MQRNDVIDHMTDAGVALPLAFLAQHVVACPDAVAILHACATALAFDERRRCWIWPCMKADRNRRLIVLNSIQTCFVCKQMYLSIAPSEYYLIIRPFKSKGQGMKLLPIDAAYRRWLTSTNAIGFNADLQERLAGLTYDESLFYIKKFAVFAVAWFAVSDADIGRFLDLHERHASSFEFEGRRVN